MQNDTHFDKKPPRAANSVTLLFHFERPPLCPACGVPLAYAPWKITHGIAWCVACDAADPTNQDVAFELIKHAWATDHTRTSHGILFWTPSTKSGRPISVERADAFLSDRPAVHEPRPERYDPDGYEKHLHNSHMVELSQDQD